MMTIQDAPRTGGMILLYWAGHDGGELGYWHDRMVEWVSPFRRFATQPTHWLPMPMMSEAA